MRLVGFDRMRQENQLCGLFGGERSTLLVDGAAGSRRHAFCVGARRENTEETLHDTAQKRKFRGTNETPPIERVSSGHELVARLHLPVESEEQLHLKDARERESVRAIMSDS